ncbi:uncharacterized protein LOC132301773 [Cornus florida]|uniref:uncharacterized protein LOC132301773 n=1 Tax=Cornus florida TaxID=4283 RepID=UPI0028982D25|nr:uncharacterized protein LOC132301773 [Cornus florida]
MTSSLRDIPVFESISPLNSSDSDRENIFEIHQKRMIDVRRLLSPDRVQAFFQPCKRKYIKCDREEAAQRLIRDYFVENLIYPPNMFRKRFRIRRELFLRILNSVIAYDKWFIQKPDALGRMGFTLKQKMTTAIHILVYGISTDLPTLTKCKRHVCYDKGKKEEFPVFKSMIDGTMPSINYMVNGHRRTMGYYLSDDIYLKWATLMQTILHPTTVKEKLFANKREAVRKDIERAFRVLQMRWAITHQLVLYWNTEDLNKIMKTCIVLHNMVIEDEGEHIL